MTSELTTEEFELRLGKVISIGPPWIMSSPFAIFTIFNNSDKLFYGEVDKGQFQLTRNSILPFSNTYYVINGQYRCLEDNDNKRVEVEYKIQPLRFYYVLERLVVILFLVLINSAFYASGEATVRDYIVANTFIFLYGLIRINLSRSNKRKLEIKLQQEFRLKL